MNKELIEYSQADLPVYDVDLDAPPRERWREVCLAEGESLHALIREFEALVEEYLEYLPKKMQMMVRPLLNKAGLFRPLLRTTGSFASAVASCFGQDYVEEIKGIARYADLPHGSLFIGNLFYDINQMLEAKAPWKLGCSSFSVCMDGAPALLRNLDWNMPETTGEYTRLIRFHRGRESYLSASVLGTVGVLSAQRAGHWAATLNQAPAAQLPVAPFQWPCMCRLRAVCDQMGTFDEFRDELQAYQTMTPFFTHLIGTAPEEQVVISGMGKEFQETISPNGGALVQTNHFQEEELESLNPPEWEDDSRHRFQILCDQLEESPGDWEAACRIMEDPDLTYEATQNQMVLQPAGNLFRLWVRRPV